MEPVEVEEGSDSGSGQAPLENEPTPPPPEMLQMPPAGSGERLGFLLGMTPSPSSSKGLPPVAATGRGRKRGRAPVPSSSGADEPVQKKGQKVASNSRAHKAKSPVGSSVIKKGRRVDNHGVRPFNMKVLGMFGHIKRATYIKVPNHKRTAADFDYANAGETEGERDFAVKKPKKMKTANPCETHTDQRSQKRKHILYDAKELAEHSTKKIKKSKKRTEGHKSSKNNQDQNLEGSTSLNEGSHGRKCKRGISVKSLRDTSSGTKNIEEGTSGLKCTSSWMQSPGDAEKLAKQSTKKRKGKKKKDENSRKMNMHSDLLVSEKVVNNRSEETQGSKYCVKSQTLKLGKGKKAFTGKKVTIGYTGKLQNGTIFGSTFQKKPLVFKLGDHKVIDGVDAGIIGMRVGGQRKLTIPPSLGFGDVKMDNIPENSTLEIDVKLFKVVD